ncbi:GPI transamidase component PIG-T [Aphelenchoides avenae]|nr:GPI transamidase component PIG-T [Aphelenchus avenae]
MSLWHACAESVNEPQEIFKEELHLSELVNEDILADFRFTILANSSNKLDHVPWIIRKIFDKYALSELRLSITQGYWRNSLWRAQPKPEAPSGALLVAKFKAASTSVDDRWNSLLNLLNGIFCTSFLAMNPALTASPSLMFGGEKEQSSGWRYGASSGEPVCTENFKPWRQMLPCKESGLVHLLEPRTLYSANFHSMFIHAKRSDSSWFLQLGSNMVADARTARHSQDKSWSLYSVLGRKVLGKCAVANVSRVLTTTSTTSNVTPNGAIIGTCGAKQVREYAADGDYEIPLNIQVKPAKDASREDTDEPSPSIHTYAQNVNQNGGRITTRISNHEEHALDGILTHLVPWNIRIYTHTISYSCDTMANQTELIRRQQFTLARDRKRPLLVELEFGIPSHATCRLSVDYETVHMRLSEYPPDSSSGIFISGPSVQLRPRLPATSKSCFGLAHGSSDEYITLHGEPLLILLPVPDFSMPFNVLCFVCTVIALYFGPAHTMTTRIFVPQSEEEAKKPQTKLAKLIHWMQTLPSKLMQWVKSKLSKQKTE